MVRLIDQDEPRTQQAGLDRIIIDLLVVFAMFVAYQFFYCSAQHLTLNQLSRRDGLLEGETAVGAQNPHALLDSEIW